MRPPILRLHADRELVIDSFAGGGGASLGIELALGRSPDIAINHDPEAIAMHAVNHPTTRHYHQDVWKVDPRGVCAGRPVGLAWFSPDCKHFSKAKGGRPREQKIRGLAWVVIRWAKAVRPRVIILENVEEFADWGPLLDDGTPCPARRGFTFRRWLAQLHKLGYQTGRRELRAADYGAATTRKRLFVIARCDGMPIEWPEATHTPETYRTAAECIDWALPCPSIFERDRPLAEKTLARIARGLRKYVIDSPDPFIVPVTHAGDHRAHSIHEPMRTVTAARRGELALVAPSMIQRSWGERKGQAPRALDIERPLGTIVAGGIKHALVSAFLAKHYGGHEGSGRPLPLPIDTITTRDHHALVASSMVKLYGTCTDGQQMTLPFPTVRAQGTHLAEVRAFLLKYYGTEQDPRLERPLGTLTTKHRFGLVTVHGADYAIADIGMRMLSPRELFRAQGFPDRYVIDHDADGQAITKTAQVRMCGNSVCPPIARALVLANYAAQGARKVAAGGQ